MLSVDEAERAGVKDPWYQAMKRFVMEWGDAPEEYLVYLHDRVTRLFQKDEYEVTSWIAHMLMYDSRPVDMLVYPSLQAPGGDLCHAIHSAPVDSRRVELHFVEQLQEREGGRLERIRQGIPTGGTIRWEHVRPE